MSADPKKSSATWCILPWIHLFVGESGALRPCCMTLEDPDMANRDEDGNPYFIYAPEGIEAAWNSVFMRTMRRDMLAGRRPAACSRCFRDEDLGIRSHRQLSNALFANHRAEALQRTAADGAAPSELICSLDIRLGNRCNLKCRMCSPQSSKALIPEWAARHGLPVNHRYFDTYRHLDWFERPEFWAMLEEEAPRLQRINFAGGEPLLIGPMFDYLERQVASGRAAALTVSYNTNLTVLPERVFTLWHAFKAVRITVSLDGFGAVNEFIRFPSRWSEIDANLRTLNAQADALNLGAGLATNIAVQIYNVFRLGELLDYIASELPRFEVPNLSIVTYPEAFCLRVLPAELKALASERLRASMAASSPLWRQRWGEGAQALIAALEGVIDHMNGEDRSHLLPQFLRWARHQDQFRGQDTASAIPELAPLMAASAPPNPT